VTAASKHFLTGVESLILAGAVATVMAGVGRMRFSVYALYSVIGGVLWTDGILLLGRALGHIKFVRDTIAPKIDLILITVVVLSLLPTIVHWWRSRPSKVNR